MPPSLPGDTISGRHPNACHLKLFLSAAIGCALFFLTCLLLPDRLSANEGLDGVSEAGNYSDLQLPLEVSVAIRVSQITDVNQKSENFGTVLTIRMQWRDPSLAFSAEEFGRNYKVFRPGEFVVYANALPTIVPSFVIQNQQANRWIQLSRVVVFADGTTWYYERSSATLQAPYFDFRRFPFDTQQFYVELVSNHPEQEVKFVPLDTLSGLGEKLGEEEWVLADAKMQISTVPGLTGDPSAKAALAFTGKRHLTYYITRILTPMVILIFVSWSIFFLGDYRKRAEIAGANLLVFVGFNWMISDSLPKLGYVTFIDFILQWMFVVTGSIVILNVGLEWLKNRGREPLAETIDTYVIKWIYPLGYIGVVGFAVMQFLYVR